MHLRGFDRRGAAAALHNATSNSIRCSGVFRSADDFAVLVFFKRDNIFEHHSVRWLEDGDLSGMTLSFDYDAGDGIAPLDSTFFESIPNRSLSFVRNNGTSGTTPLFEHATLQSGSFDVASETFHFSESGGGFKPYDRIVIWYLNLAFEYSPTSKRQFAEFAFFNLSGTDAQHSIIAPTQTYTHTQLGSDGSGDLANALVALVNAGAGDPDVIASIGSAGHVVRLGIRGDDASSFNVSAVDGGYIGGGSATLDHIQLTTFPRRIAESINSFDWNSPAPSLGLIAEASGTNLTIKPARYGTCNVASDGVTVTWVAGHKFQGLAVGAIIHVNGEPNVVASVDSNTSLQLTNAVAVAPLGGVRFLTERGGRDGNFLRLRRQALRPSSGTVNVAAGVVTYVSGNDFTGLIPNRSIRVNNVDFGIASVDSATQLTLDTVTGTANNVSYAATIEDNPGITTAEDELQLEDGSSDVVWRVALDFSNTLVKTDGDSIPQPIDDLFEAWLTIAPRLTDAADFVDAEFALALRNMSVADPNNHRPLQIAGPGSVRINSRQRDIQYDGFGWVEKAGFYDQGFARETAGWGERVTIKYRCQFTHDLYVGTEIKNSGSSVTVTLDSDSPTSLNTQMVSDPPIVAIRKVRTNVPAGVHQLALTCDGNGVFTFDHIEAAVPSDVPDPSQVFTDISMATDWDTDATYKLPAERLLWQLDRSGLVGDLNHFVGNFFHYNRRKRAGTGLRNEATVTFAGIWSPGDAVILDLGGIFVGKSVFPGDSPESIAAHMEAFINATFVGVFAERTEASVTIKNRANLYGFDLSVNANTSIAGTVGISGSLAKGSEGIWEIDDTATPLLNRAATVWHQDFFAKLNGRGRTTTVAYNLEAYNPPESPSAHWAARYFSGRQVLTDVGFGSEGDAKIISASNSVPIQIQANKHGFSSGDRVVVSGVPGNSAANGSFVITVVSADLLTLDGSNGTASGAYTANPVGNDFVRRTLKTTHLAPNPVVASFLKSVYTETADLMAAASLPVKLQFGENLWWFFSDSTAAVLSVSATAPVRVTTVEPHNFTSGDTVVVSGVKSPSVASGTHTITVANSTAFDLNGADGIGSTITLAPNSRVVGGAMAFYDAGTTAVAVTALGRPLVRFTSQDSDPAINSGEDADFLRDRLATHLDAIVSHVRSTHPSAIFELLYPFDVLHPTVYHTAERPYPQGGRLNHHVSTPPNWKTPADTDRRLKIEALSWGAFFRHGDLAEEAMLLWTGTHGFNWPRNQVAYLIPWFNGGTPWQREFLAARRINPGQIHFWALDHYRLLEWPRLPRPIRRSGFFGR
jgi:hypothetical protein